ncbi:10644_t:CDS:2, partial [Cetraspora pellucida]
SNSVELLAPSFQENIQNQQENEDNTTNESFNDEEIADSNSLEEEFGQFLNVWVEISANETEELANIDDDDDLFSLSVGDTVHPAVDSNAKWDLITLFNELPLL